MNGLNNLDVIILIVIGISALIALSRGLVKEVLSIVGWVLATMSIIYLLPVLMPFAKAHISNGILEGTKTLKNSSVLTVNGDIIAAAENAADIQ